jgi:hypothetical protein
MYINIYYNNNFSYILNVIKKNNDNKIVQEKIIVQFNKYMKILRMCFYLGKGKKIEIIDYH